MRSLLLLGSVLFALRGANDVSASELHIHGSVTDATTGQPIPKFRVILGTPYHEIHTRWQEHMIREQADGAYDWKLDRCWPETRVRIEAPGYRPVVSELLSPGNYPFDANLENDIGLKGQVLDQDGTPVEGAKVALVSHTQELMVENGTFRYCTGKKLAAEIEKSDADGKFRLGSEVDPYLIVAAHDEAGFALVEQEEVDQLTRSGKPVMLRLAPWCRIEGRWADNDQPLANGVISFGAGWQPKESWPVLSHHNKTETDADGRFAAERVAPGHHYVQLWTKTEEGSMSSEPTRSVTATSGETLHLSIGEQRRTVVGKLVPHAELPEGFDWSEVELETKIPAPPFAGGTNGEAFVSWSNYLRTAEGKKSLRQSIPIDPDGTFRIEDLPPAEYDFNLSLKAGSKFGEWNFNSGRQYSVPYVDDSDKTPCDLGKVTVGVWKQEEK